MSWKFNPFTKKLDRDTSSVGDITGVIAGVGLSGGGNSGDVTLSLHVAYTDALYLQITNDLSDLNDAAVARTNLGLGALAVLDDLSTFDTGDLSEGANLYYTDARVATYGDANYLKLDASNDPITGDLLIQPSTDSITAFQINQADTTNVLTADTTNARVGIGTDSPDSVFHIKANFPGIVGNDYAGQIIIQNPANSVFSNAVITGYESDGDGNPDQQLWYLGSSSVGNSDIIFLNRRNSKLALGTSGTSRITILGDGSVGIGTTEPGAKLQIDTVAAATKGLIVKGAASQSANLQEWQDSNAAVLANITPTGGALFSDKVIFTQIDGNEFIDSLNDGYLDLAATTAIRVNTNLTSDADSTDDLGTPSIYWANAYIDKLFLNATATLDGATAGLVNITGNVGIRSSAELRFYDNGNYVGFEAPALSADQIWVLPAADGNNNEVLTTNGAGVLSWSAPSAGVSTHTVRSRAYRNGNQVIGHGSTTVVQYNIESYDDGSDYDHATNHDFIAPQNGFYLVIASIVFTNTDVTAGLSAWISINNAQTQYINGGEIAGKTTVHGSGIFELATDDTVDVQVYQTSGGNVTVEGARQDSHFEVHLISTD